MSPQGRDNSPGAREEELSKARRQTKEEQRIIERTKEALLKEVEKGARDMRHMGIRLTEILEPLHDVRRDMCVSEGRFSKRPWTIPPSLHRQG